MTHQRTHQRRLIREAIDNIYVASDRRPARPDAVEALAESIRKVGLLNPVVVRHVQAEVTMADGEVVESAYHLVFGRHRLAAVKRLGLSEIDCEVIDVSARRARMLEIAENLHRADLTALERNEQTAEWLRLAAEEEAGEDGLKLVQLAPVPPLIGTQTDVRGNVRPGGRGHEGGARAASRELGIEHTEAVRAAQIDNLAPEAKAEAKALNLDNNQSALLNAARATTKEEQLRALREAAAKRAERQEMSASEKRIESAVNAVRRLSQEELLVFADWFDAYREDGGAA